MVMGQAAMSKKQIPPPLVAVGSLVFGGRVRMVAWTAAWIYGLLLALSMLLESLQQIDW